MCFNRTSVRLKPAGAILIGVVDGCFNRTSVRLKLHREAQRGPARVRFNRTSVRLKRSWSGAADYVEIASTAQAFV